MDSSHVAARPSCEAQVSTTAQASDYGVARSPRFAENSHEPSRGQRSDQDSKPFGSEACQHAAGVRVTTAPVTPDGVCIVDRVSNWLSNSSGTVQPSLPIRRLQGTAKSQVVVLRMGELGPFNPRVPGSIPGLPTTNRTWALTCINAC